MMANASGEKLGRVTRREKNVERLSAGAKKRVSGACMFMKLCGGGVVISMIAAKEIVQVAGPAAALRVSGEATCIININLQWIFTASTYVGMMNGSAHHVLINSCSFICIPGTNPIAIIRSR